MSTAQQCPRCQGKGEVPRGTGYYPVPIACSYCGGTGQLSYDTQPTQAAMRRRAERAEAQRDELLAAGKGVVKEWEGVNLGPALDLFRATIARIEKGKA